MTKYFIIEIKHPNTEKTFNFRSNTKLNVGEIAVCRTRRGYRLGEVISIHESTADEAKAHSGIAARATARRQAKLSPYDRATVVLKTTKNEEEAVKCFNPYNNAERNALVAFLYNETGASYINTTYDVLGCGNIVVNVFDFRSARKR